MTGITLLQDIRGLRSKTNIRATVYGAIVQNDGDSNFISDCIILDNWCINATAICFKGFLSHWIVFKYGETS